MTVTTDRVETTTTVVRITAGDGRPLPVAPVEGERRPTRGLVLVVHGAGVRAELFRPPTSTTFVDALIRAGYDVWLENWRASIDLPPTEWTLDQAAVHDHPVAVREVAARTGADDIKAVVHCQGSTSFVMSAMAGLTPQVSPVVSNAVSVPPVIPPFSEFKIKRMLPLVKKVTP